MANPSLKFKKVASYPTSGVTQGDIIFCTGDHTIYLATGSTSKEAFYGGNVKNVTHADNKLTFSFMDGTQDLVVDFSGFNSWLEALQTAVNSKVSSVDGIKAIEIIGTVNEPMVSLKIDEDTPGNVTLAQDDSGLRASFTPTATEKKDIAIDANDGIGVSTFEKVKVMGVTVGNLSNGEEIPAGKSLTEILKMIFQKTIDAKVGANPSVTLKATGITNGALVEVNAAVTATLSHDYSDGKFVGAESAYSYNQTAGCAKGAVKYFYNGNEITSPHTPTITEGSHQYKCTAAYGASTNTPKKNNGDDSAVKIAAGTATSNTITIYGRYPVYACGVQSGVSDTTAPTVDGSSISSDGNKLALVNDNTQFGVAFPAMTATRGYRILLQKGKTIKSAKALNGLTGKYDIDVTSKFQNVKNVFTRPCGVGTAEYYMWEYGGNEGANRVIFTIG